VQCERMDPKLTALAADSLPESLLGSVLSTYDALEAVIKKHRMMVQRLESGQGLSVCPKCS
jgi:hypothetical protein